MQLMYVNLDKARHTTTVNRTNIVQSDFCILHKKILHLAEVTELSTDFTNKNHFYDFEF